MKRIAFSTLGCRLNQYETDAIVSTFRDAGYDIVNWNGEADAYVINTCTVTDRSDRKSRALVYQAIRAAGRPETGEREPQEPGTPVALTQRSPTQPRASADPPIVLVTGCFVENEANTLVNDERITYVVDNDRKSSIFRIIDGHLSGVPVDVEKLPADRFSFPDPGSGFHTRRAIKIQDGCDNFCTFCIIPHVRGKAVSRPFDEVIRQASESIKAGAREIVITGVNIGRYRYHGTGFAQLLESILRLEGEFRVRVSSIEPDAGNRDGSWERGLIALLDHPKMCPHLHLCVQSGSDRILEAMGRGYSVSDVLGTMKAIREKRPDFNLTTDVMVGFPGEGEEDFSRTLQFIEKARFSHIHTFPYSVRPGTTAAGMQHQVPYEVKTRRAKAVRAISALQKCGYRESFIGKEQLLLVESVKNGVVSGYGEHYVPIEVTVDASGPAGGIIGASGPPGGNRRTAVNSWVPVKITSLGTGPDPVLRGVFN